MNGEFADVAGTIRWISEQLRWHFPDSTGELYLDPRGPFHPRQHHGDLGKLLPLLAEFCSQMPRAWVNYEPDHPYGIVTKVVGHCDCPDGGCTTVCRNYDERPHAILTISRIGNTEILLGGFRGLGKGGGI